MSALAELQARFLASVLGARGDESPRMARYRVNARENFADALGAAFPLLAALVGAEEFRQMAWAYQRERPSTSGNLFHAGKHLAAFLQARVTDTPDAHLVDVARLEWAIQESMVAADADGAPDLRELAALPPERHGDLRFRLHPSVRLLRLAYPLFDRWQALRREPPAAWPAEWRPERHAELLVVLRRRSGVELHRVPAGDLDFLEALARGMSFADALEARADLPAAELGTLLARWVHAGVITGFDLPPDPLRP